MTPGVSILQHVSQVGSEFIGVAVRLALKVFHDIQEPIIHIRTIDEANFHLIQIA